MARAQQATMPVIGFLDVPSLEARRDDVAAFQRGLKETGYVEGQNVAIEYRWAGDQNDRLPELAVLSAVRSPQARDHQRPVRLRPDRRCAPQSLHVDHDYNIASHGDQQVRVWLCGVARRSAERRQGRVVQQENAGGSVREVDIRSDHEPPAAGHGDLRRAGCNRGPQRRTAGQIRRSGHPIAENLETRVSASWRRANPSRSSHSRASKHPARSRDSTWLKLAALNRIQPPERQESAKRCFDTKLKLFGCCSPTSRWRRLALWCMKSTSS